MVLSHLCFYLFSFVVICVICFCISWTCMFLFLYDLKFLSSDYADSYRDWRYNGCCFTSSASHSAMNCAFASSKPSRKSLFHGKVKVTIGKRGKVSQVIDLFGAHFYHKYVVFY
ncbi:uncharacterized protein TM35_000141800 [Trypanosoma theileri]|uniref:Uncharacterized protein n=1 Tax=Trypanosoma theileri TaxID=67003 RepID=A0A1X0NXN5_9TRYP|nr:uncharacterized protein TM35_000141800 [Trypanosoma theileri]ORC88969.1 hypothetical protein TM35_000141800 [Trypanosoma theileri]